MPDTAKRGAHVERLSEPARVFVEEGTPSRFGIDEVYRGDRPWLLRALFESERLKRGLEAEQRGKRDVHHKKYGTKGQRKEGTHRV